MATIAAVVTKDLETGRVLYKFPNMLLNDRTADIKCAGFRFAHLSAGAINTRPTADIKFLNIHVNEDDLESFIEDAAVGVNANVISAQVKLAAVPSVMGFLGKLPAVMRFAHQDANLDCDFTVELYR